MFFLEQFLIECSHTKTKVNTLLHDNRGHRQSSEVIKIQRKCMFLV